MTESRHRLIAEIIQEMAAARTAGRRHGFRHLMGKSVSLTHLHVLSILRAEGSMPVHEIARALDVSPAGATGIVRRMEERGLVERRRDDADRRVVTIVLARGGQAALDEIDGRGREFFGRVLERLKVGELEHLRGGLRALGRAREEIETEMSTRKERSA